MDRSLFFDDEVAPAILRVIREAQKYVLVVSPYVEFMSAKDTWSHAMQAIDDALRRRVEVTFLLREDHAQEESVQEEINWLLSKKAKVLALDRLHAKVYLSEATTLVSSMNFTRQSVNSSRELALQVTAGEAEQVRTYVETLRAAARPVPRRSTAGDRLPQVLARAIGVCIRCGRPVPPDPNRPLCDVCYESWAEYENEDYEEKFCHACGRPERTSYARPLCHQCYAASAR